MNRPSSLFVACVQFAIVILGAVNPGSAQVENNTGSTQIARFKFDGDMLDSLSRGSANPFGDLKFVNGLAGQALSLHSGSEPSQLGIKSESIGLNLSESFSVSFWVRTELDSDSNGVLLATKSYPDNSLDSQRKKGWAFYAFNGSWAWNIGSGNRRLTCQHDNGHQMPINDGRWHQLAMTYDKSKSVIRLYFDGINRGTYNVRDSGRFEFSNDHPLTIGCDDNRAVSEGWPVGIVSGRKRLQELVDRFCKSGLSVESDQFRELVSSPRRFYAQILKRRNAQTQTATDDVKNVLSEEDLAKLEKLSKRLMANRYTVNQNGPYREVARFTQLYRLVDGRVVVQKEAAERFAKRERLSQAAFDIDNLTISKGVVSSDDIQNEYAKFYRIAQLKPAENQKTLTAASWNIYHGGLHASLEKDGWDSRDAIVELIKREKIDIVMMQETYSSGEYIAAELGFYFATTIDWDNMFQGANISVLSRFPIDEIYVPPSSTFMNVAAKISISETQKMYAMSNWYGMRNFSKVYEFHKERFSASDDVPILFAGDFNAVPDSDGGKSLASRVLIEDGFVDAFRNLHPDVQTHPGPTHVSKRRIDQLYFKGQGLTNKSTTVHSEWPSGFPSDHYLVKSVFDLDYVSSDE